MKNRLVFLGGGINSAVGKVHLMASQLDLEFEVVGGCFSRNPTINRETGLAWGIASEYLYYEFEELLTACDPNTDIVAILTPTPEHFSAIKIAISKGFSVITEKAMASNASEASQLHELSIAKKVPIYCIYNYTGYPMVREARRMIEDGMLGRVSHARFEMPQEGYVRVSEDNIFSQPQDWRMSDQKIPTISLDLGIHIHQLIDFLIPAPPLNIQASESSGNGFLNVVDNVFASVRCADGTDISCWYSKCSAGFRNGLSFSIFGDLGSLSWIQSDPEHLVYSDNMGGRQILDRASSASKVASQSRYSRFKAGHPAGFIEAFANQYVDISQVIGSIGSGEHLLASSPYVFGPQTAVNGLLFLEALHESAKMNQAIAIKSLGK